MSFSASNNRILVTDGAATVFDTNDDIPHILATASYSLSVNFPTPSSQQVMTYIDPCGTTQPVYVCRYETQYICRDVYGCTNDYVCTPTSECGIDAFGNYSCTTGQSCGYVTTCGYTSQCGYESVQICGFENQCAPVYYFDWQYNPLEWSQTYVLGDLPYGIDSNFVLVKATAVRASVGGTNYYGNLQATVGSETFAFQGSALLEAGGRSDGTRFLSRIISVYADNSSKKLMLEARHSNGLVDPPTGGLPSDGSLRSLASSFNINLSVYFGRFR